MENLILIAIIAAIVGLAGLYIWRQKKKGSKCIGCPYGSACCKNTENGGGGCRDHN